jgi:predicted MFS family arabinose efflux permease
VVTSTDTDATIRTRAVETWTVAGAAGIIGALIGAAVVARAGAPGSIARHAALTAVTILALMSFETWLTRVAVSVILRAVVAEVAQVRSEIRQLASDTPAATGLDPESIGAVRRLHQRLGGDRG